MEKLKSGLISFEEAGRLVSIFSSLASATFLYLIVKEAATKWLALLSMAIFLFLPYNIYYSRTILPEPMMVMFSLGSICFLKLKVKSEKNSKKNSSEELKRVIFGFLGIFLGMLAILVKPYAIFLLVPSWLVIFWSGFKKIRSKTLYTLYSIPRLQFFLS